MAIIIFTNTRSTQTEFIPPPFGLQADKQKCWEKKQLNKLVLYNLGFQCKIAGVVCDNVSHTSYGESETVFSLFLGPGLVVR